MTGTVSVGGLGKLGACMAACFAERGFDVIGVDVNPATIAALNEGAAPIYEPQLDAYVARNRLRLRATNDYEAAVHASDITFVVVPTPSTLEGGFSLRYVGEAALEIGRALATKDAYHVVAITSTVMPGSTGYGIVPILERESGKRCGVDFGVCYSPEFIALGSVIHDFLAPDFLLIGESDRRAGGVLEACYRKVVPESTPVARMNFAEAELAKLAVNTFVTTKITFANMLAELCERLPGASVDAVTRGIGLDSRIGRKYLTGAMAYGGPCFPRDNVALSHLARTLGVDPGLAEATDMLNSQKAGRLASMCAARLPAGARVVVLGVSYKPGSNIVDESPGLALLNALAREGYEAVGYDPLDLKLPDGCLAPGAVIAGSPAEAFARADAIILANADDAFDSETVLAMAAAARPSVIFDCWRRWRAHLDRFPHADYVAIGLAQGNPADADALRTLVTRTLFEGAAV
ncbi:MAG: UDP-glucose/GDP-mannose dehydrogenase family protein [Chloroflexi bacterium]|nr:UDP-glucose/GDP-mannose dehydrogenase family protein [Chloroflexota bacterium]